ncbi:hypothetical protein FJV41_22045 [Myxococcus llanfairpwllgwyngyllgogerychwyrndrobwllllantysiliogogogochensis]|uniref:Uncharacterized protein n=1 Tax=Myxococcus llanfairpwllgwyngyllgogerychwyrndrobwllllantysiliogogogochensis TaxID=2590453 RepID=A0A540WXQ5_9BACT|nr:MULTISPECIES: hypothetical protein [unclassified Myxococcus]NTX10391.1 hypothetical protein [Myxococcus sp. CA056]NTX52258.1 hypothetical protein [Myxococcus sp. CA039A]TQF13782.1 hypothetical protein FJV41_22045 [Myxococcus llanfairpwllgwyngyllgogerychwyrndrobwllllantysiliogogogochensis]
MGPVSVARSAPGARVAEGAGGAYTRGIVSGLSRLLTLVLLLGWQVAASGVAGLGHYCEKQVQTRASKCRCHEHSKADSSHADSHGQPTLQWDCCEEPHWDLPAPTEGSVSSASPFVAPPVAVPPVAWLPLKAPEWGSQRSLSLWNMPPSQGPPVFLRIRTLLL